jgi:putative hemolysin
MPSLWEFLIIPILVGMNAFFVGAEYALVAARPVHVEQLGKRGRQRTALAIQALKAQPAAAIGAIQICITVTNLLLGAFGEPVMTETIKVAVGPLASHLPEAPLRITSLVLSFLVVTFVTVVFSELLPKALTLRFVLPVATLTAFPMRLILTATRPLVWLMNKTANLATIPLGLGRVENMEAGESHSTDEIRLLAGQAADSGNLSTQERSLILNALSFGRRRAKQIMVPRVRVAYLDLQRDMEENRRVMNEHLYSRLPLCDGGMDNVLGIVPTKEFLSAYHAEGDTAVLGLIARPAVFAPESISLDQLLILFDQKKTQMAFLVDEHGGVEGIVTLRDVVDELVGEPMDHDTSSERLTLPGDTPLHEIRELLDLPDFANDESVVTVGGLVASRLGRIPRPGEEIDITGVKIKVLEADARAVRKVTVAAPPREPPKD